MTTTILRFSMLGAGALILSACGSAPQAAAPPPAAVELAAPRTAKPEVSINEVMVALVDHAGHSLWDVEQEGKAPKSDADWQTVWEHAVQIAAAGPAITVGGTGPSDAGWVKSPSWHTYAQRMSDAGVAARNAAKSKNFKGLVMANSQLVETCENCHKEFKPDMPTEGIVHTHAH
jgi:cytochrome c556